MGTAIQDLRFATRALLHNRTFTLTVLLLLTLSIGVTTAIFSFVSGILVRPLPLPGPEQVIVLNETNLEKGQLRSTISPRNLEDWERESQTIVHFGAWRDWGFRITIPDGPVGVASAIASPGLFDVLGLQPVLGRSLLPGDNKPLQDQVILISHRFWQAHFGGDASVIGRSLLLDHKSFTVVGVLLVALERLNIGRFDIWSPVAYWAVDLFSAFSPGAVPRLQQVRIDGQVLGFTVVLTLLTGLLFGLVPAALRHE